MEPVDLARVRRALQRLGNRRLPSHAVPGCRKGWLFMREIAKIKSQNQKLKMKLKIKIQKSNQNTNSK
jgi:hypothetical protein